MIPSKKFEQKRPQIDESSDARKSPKIARKSHEKHTSQEREINTTLNASIQQEVRISTIMKKI
jgi:hypothetical protein